VCHRRWLPQRRLRTEDSFTQWYPVGEGRVEATPPFVVSADEGLDIGRETGTAVAAECDVETSAFTGQINWVELKVGEEYVGIPSTSCRRLPQALGISVFGVLLTIWEVTRGAVRFFEARSAIRPRRASVGRLKG